jgi:hypothetical protein
VQIDVHGRKANGAAAFIPVGDPTADAVGPAKAGGCLFEIADGEGLPDAGTADPFVAVGYGIHTGQGKTMHATGIEQGIETAGAVLTEAKIVADIELTDGKSRYQDTLDEFVGAHLGQVMIEFQQQHVINAAGLNGL